ncbi:MAG: FAS1-like dehydratase domain-containing protein [Acidimicrobiales bacterium]
MTTQPPDTATELHAAVGAAGTPTTPRHPVNEPMIVHWCDAMGDANPCYTDAAFAAGSVHGGLVAPPAMLDVWDRPGLHFARDGSSPRTGVLNTLFAQGFDSILAVNTELELTRYARPGEWLSSTEILADISPLKHTSRGPGHFLTTRHRYVNQDGEHLGDLMFRILVFRPDVDERATKGSSSGATPPSADPALRPQPAINEDNAFFWEGARQHELRVQQCRGCGVLHSPPGPRCGECGSFDMGWLVASGRGSLYSFAVPEHPRVAGFAYPLCVGLVELQEGTRLVANVLGVTPLELEVGMPLELSWLEGGTFPLPQFGPPAPERRTDTVPAGEVVAGQAMGLCSIPVTATLVVAGAIATRDYTAVHHDPAVARREGSQDIFPNINTTVGLVQRVVTDWLGPEIVFASIRLRLGVPAYPGELLTFSGTVVSADPITGAVALAVTVADSLGDHGVATVELLLPTGSGRRASDGGAK